MIKFFRKIRYGLLEKKKTGKYLKYAFGEIVLVIVGILIALQINNWNENRKLNNSIQNYYQQLLVDLEADKKVAENVIANIESFLVQYNNYKDLYAEPNLSISKVFEEVQHFDYSTGTNVQFQTSTIKTLISTGDIKFITPVLRDKLTNYEGWKSTLISSSQNSEMPTINILQSASMDVGGIDFLIRLQNQPELMKIFDIENKLPEIVLKIEAYLIWREVNGKLVINALNQLIEDVEIIRELISLEIEP